MMVDEYTKSNESPPWCKDDNEIDALFAEAADHALTSIFENEPRNTLSKMLHAIIFGGETLSPTFHGFHGLESWLRLPIDTTPKADIHVPYCMATNPETLKLSAYKPASWDEIVDNAKKVTKELRAKYLASLNSRYITKAQAIGLCKLMVMGVYGDPGYSEVVAIPGDELLRLPDADVVPAKRAHYIPKAECGRPNRIAECSWCGFEVPYPGENYCPHCGAEMQDEEECK